MATMILPAELAAQKEAAVLEQVKSVPPPEGIRFKKLFYDLDHTGDPAVRIIFTVGKPSYVPPARIRKLVDFTTKVTEAVLSLGLPEFPYVMLEDGK